MESDFELYFLIVKFLRAGACPEAAALLESTLNKDKAILPVRYDWKGEKHNQTFAEIERQFPHVKSDQLSALCQYLKSKELRDGDDSLPSGSGSRSDNSRRPNLSGRQSLLSLPIPKKNRVPRLQFSPHQHLIDAQLGLRKSYEDSYSFIYKRMKLLRRTLGHLSSVFCLAFDKTGQYVFTGADDLLVKMWGTYNGRLYFTFRGARAEISDMAISSDNRLLAAGSVDKIIRVWCLLTAAPVAVLAKHSGNITALNFCPAEVPGVPSYLAATSSDGTVSFWRYTTKDKVKNRAVFEPEPTRYHERMRPGTAQMICAAFSPGGIFFATGSFDQHVRVYMMDGKDGPTKVLEQEAHADRVDSIQWANKKPLHFASGSKDGSARVWWLKEGEWHSAQLLMRSEDGRNLHYNQHRQAEEPLRVTMTSWNRDDTRILTAVSDASLHIWDAQTFQLLRRLKGHKDEVYVLEPHPSHPDILLSAAHDGNLMIWNMETGERLAYHHNFIEGQGHGAIYDAEWCPDQLHVAASDSHGNVLFFGTAPSDRFKACPEEMFFHTDYRPLLQDSSHHVVDEQTQCAPHLLPPPFLVDAEGNPYPADMQRLVPGREHLSDQELLAPNLSEPEQASTAGQPGGSDTAPPTRRVSGDRHRSGDLAPASNIDQLIAELAANTLRQPGAARRNDQEQPRPSLDPISEHSYASSSSTSRRLSSSHGGGASTSAGLGLSDSPEPGPSTSNGSDQANGSRSDPPRSSGDAAGTRGEASGSRGEAAVAREDVGFPLGSITAPSAQPLTRSIWRKRALVAGDKHNWSADLIKRREMGSLEITLYTNEMKKKRQSGGGSLGLASRHEGLERLVHGGTRRRTAAANANSNSTAASRRNVRQQRRAQQQQARGEADPDANEEEGEDNNQQEREDSEEEEEDADFNGAEESGSESVDESELEESESSSSSSTEYSDWGANNLTPPQRTARKSGRAAATSKPASSEDEAEEVKEPKPGPSRASQEDPEDQPGPSRVRRRKYDFNPGQLEEIPSAYLPSSWLAEYIPKKSPYFPQMGDEVMYFKQGHRGYINLVKHRDSYPLNMKEQQWLKRDDIRNVELVKVIGMKYEIRPPRLCCLKLAIMNQETNQLTGENFSIKYHDMNDVVDFLVLRHNYEAAMRVKWRPGDRYRCQIDDAWWFGTVMEVSPFDPEVPSSPFLSVLCLWDSGEEERLSPWDLESLDSGMQLPKKGTSVAVTKEEIERHIYQPLPDEWRGLNNKTECKRISRGLEQVMALAIAEPFNYPVDLTSYPDYMLEIDYPMDFSLIKSRLDNLFYRRTTAIQFDVRYIATNAECYNRPKTDIVKNARIVTDLVLRIIQDPGLTDVNGQYHRLVDNFRWEDTQEPKQTRPAGRSKKKSTSESPVNPKQWKHDCNELLNQMFENKNSVPFRQAVSEIDFPDYTRIITTPMDLSLIRESLRVGEYETPLDLKEDMDLMFSNSFRYNTDNMSRVVAMTKRLKEFFEDKFHLVVKEWRKVNRRLNFLKRKEGKSPSKTPRKAAERRRTAPAKGSARKVTKKVVHDSEEESEEERPTRRKGTSRTAKKKMKKKRKRVTFDSEDELDDESSDDEEEEVDDDDDEEEDEEDEEEESEDMTSEDDYKSAEDLPVLKGKKRLFVDSDDSEENTRKKDKGKGKSTKALNRRPKEETAGRSDSAKKAEVAANAAAHGDNDDLSQPGPSQADRSRRPPREDDISGRRRRAINIKESEEEETDDDIPVARRRQNLLGGSKSRPGVAGGSSGGTRNSVGRRKTKRKSYKEVEESDDYSNEEEEEEEGITSDENNEYDAAAGRRQSGQRRQRGSPRAVPEVNNQRLKRKRWQELENEVEDDFNEPKRRGKTSGGHSGAGLSTASAPRPRRQATARALSKFQESDSEDDYSDEPLAERLQVKKNSRRAHKPNRAYYSESEPEAPRRNHQGPSRQQRRGTQDRRDSTLSGRLGAAERGALSTSPRNVTISAADSSTDLVSMAAAGSQQGLAEAAESQTSGRPQRKIVKPLRLREFSENEEDVWPEETVRKHKTALSEKKAGRDRRQNTDAGEDPGEGPSNRRRRSGLEDDIGDASAPGGGGAKRKRSNVKYNEDSPEEEEEEEEEEESLASYRRRKSSSTGGKHSSKSKRMKTTPNYRDDESDTGFQHADIKPTRRSGEGGRRVTNQATKYSQYFQSAEEESEEEDEESFHHSQSQKSGGKSKGLKTSSAAKSGPGEKEKNSRNLGKRSMSKSSMVAGGYEDPEDFSPGDDEGHHQSDYDYSNRKRKSLRTPKKTNSSGRPQRMAGKSARSHFREETEGGDDDFQLKRGHGSKRRARREHHSSDNEEDYSEDDRAPSIRNLNSRSSRGRIRKMNPRLLD